MIRGVVNANLEATIDLAVLGREGEKHRVEAVVDTGFNGSLMLPARLLISLGCTRIGYTRATLADGSEKVFDLYAANVIWRGRARQVETDASQEGALVGVELLEGHALELDAVRGGEVTIKRLVRARKKKKSKRR